MAAAMAQRGEMAFRGATFQYSRVVGRSPGVVFGHGFMSDMEGQKAVVLEQLCQQQGRAYLRFNYINQPGLANVSFWRDQFLHVLDHLTNGPQVLVLSSLSGWIGVLAGVERRSLIHGIVTCAAAPDFAGFLDAETREEFDEHLATLPAGSDAVLDAAGFMDDARQHRVLRYLPAAKPQSALKVDAAAAGFIPLSCPLRLLHGLADDVVHIDWSLRLARAVASADVQLLFIKAADHRLSAPDDLKALCAAVDELTAKQ